MTTHTSQLAGFKSLHTELDQIQAGRCLGARDSTYLILSLKVLN